MFKTILAWLLSWIHDPDNIEDLVVMVGNWLFGVSKEQLTKAWDLVWDLCQQAANAFPGHGTGDQKYAWVLAKLQSAGLALAPMVIDFVIHNVLPALVKKGLKT